MKGRAVLAAAFVLATACQSARPPTDTVRNDGGDPALRADGSLAGPFARLLDAPELVDIGDAESPAEVTVLGSAAAGAISVALRQVRGTQTAATCVVTLETREGFFVGDDFLCDAYRSDEVVSTDEVAVTIDAGVATVRFRTSYQLAGGKPDVQRYEVRCTLTPTLSCTAPPAIGGYE